MSTIIFYKCLFTSVRKWQFTVHTIIDTTNRTFPSSWSKDGNSRNFSWLPKWKRISTQFERDISLCSDPTKSKSLQLFVCCQGEWVVSAWGRQRAKCLNMGLHCFDGCREEYGEVMVERNSPLTFPTHSSPIMENAFRKSDARPGCQISVSGAKQ